MENFWLLTFFLPCRNLVGSVNGMDPTGLKCGQMWTHGPGVNWRLWLYNHLFWDISILLTHSRMLCVKQYHNNMSLYKLQCASLFLDSLVTVFYFVAIVLPYGIMHVKQYFSSLHDVKNNKFIVK